MSNDRIAAKLEAMTVANGCTEAEAEVATRMLIKWLDKHGSSIALALAKWLDKSGSNIALAADPWLTVEQLSKLLDLAVPTIFKNVATGWLPMPTYVAPKAPRWRLSWIIEALDTKRALPREAAAERRKAKLGRLRTEARAKAEHGDTVMETA